ncbi:MAG: hypothetical protein ACO1RX_11830 [Candidatus Sericytochromatia bacterium]
MGIPRFFSLSVLWASLVMTGCGTSPVVGTGALSVRLHWPQPGFQTLVIPPATDRIDLRVEAPGLPAVEAVLRRENGPETRWQQTLAAGEKRVTAKALSADGTVLAEAETRVTVQVGQSAQAVLDLEPLAVPSPQPSASSTNNAGPDNNGPAEPNNPDPMATASPEPAASPSPETSPSPEPANSPTPAPTASPRNSGGGGGGGGGSSNGPVIVSMTADPAVLQGLGAATRVVVVATDSAGNETLGPTQYNWSCLETDVSNTQELNPACEGASFNSTIGSEVFWQAPTTATVTPVSDGLRYYRLTVTVNDGAASRSEDILITVPTSPGTASSIGGQNQ